MNETNREEYRLYVGIDWASAAHRVVILDAARRVVAELEVAHTGTALAALGNQLIARAGGDAAAVAVAIEVPRGPVVETLLERGCAVYALALTTVARTANGARRPTPSDETSAVRAPAARASLSFESTCFSSA